MSRILLASLIAFPLSSVMAMAEEAPENRHAIPADAKAILEKADKIELFAVFPEPTKAASEVRFHGWNTLGQTTLEKAEARKALVAAFEKGVAEYKQEGAKCFEPRHAIRATHDGKTADFLICFECAHVYVYVEGQPERRALVSHAPAELFNKMLKDAKVKVDEPAK